MLNIVIKNNNYKNIGKIYYNNIIAYLNLNLKYYYLFLH